jgi:hypothetical protein
VPGSACALVCPPGRKEDEAEGDASEDGCFDSLEEPEAAPRLVDGVHIAGPMLARERHSRSSRSTDRRERQIRARPQVALRCR